jgi:hypothetical protein
VSAELLTIAALATELGIPRGSIRKAVERHGLVPTIRGARGRGKAARFDPAAVRAWRAARETSTALADPLERATRRVERIPEIIAACAWTTYMQAGPGKDALAGHLAALAYRAIVSIDDELRDTLPGLSAPGELPEKISQLRSIADRFSRTR